MIERGRRETVRVWILLGIFATAMLGGGVAAQLGWLSSRQGALVGVGAAMLALLAFLAADRRSNEAVAWTSGGRAEREIGLDLEQLRADGTLVLHDVELDDGGYVDHIVCGPRGTFVVESKARRYEDHHLRRTKRQASSLHGQLGVWVTPVVCLAERVDRPHRRDGVWIMGKPHLLEWLSTRRGRRVDPDRARRLLCES